MQKGSLGCRRIRGDGHGSAPCGAPTPDGARVRTLVALVAAVARDRGSRVVMVAVPREEEKQLLCRAPPAIILATAALPYVPGPGRWDVRLLGAPCQWCEAAEEGYAPPCEIGRHQPLCRPSVRAPLRWKKSPNSPPWAPQTIPIANSASPTSQPKANRRRVVRVMTVVR